MRGFSGASTSLHVGAVLGVVQADADHLRARDHRGEETCLGERDAFARRLEPGEHGIAREHDELVVIDDAVARVTPGAEARDSHPSSLALPLRRPVVPAPPTWPFCDDGRMTELLWTGPAASSRVIVLAHGAGAPMDSAWMNDFAALLADRDLRVARFEFAYMASRREGIRRAATARARRYSTSTAPCSARRVEASAVPVIGGKSFGGRVASMIADELHAAGAIRGLVCLGYPFHPMGKPEQLRTAHLAELATPDPDLPGRARHHRLTRRGGGLHPLPHDRHRAGCRTATTTSSHARHPATPSPRTSPPRRTRPPRSSDLFPRLESADLRSGVQARQPAVAVLDASVLDAGELLAQ